MPTEARPETGSLRLQLAAPGAHPRPLALSRGCVEPQTGIR
jgi:hypothetical protein